MSFGEILGLLGITIPLVSAAAGGAVGLVLRIVDKHTTREEKAQSAKQEKQDKLESRVVALEVSDREKTVEIHKLQDEVRDKTELIDDAVPVMIWVGEGAEPPVPALSWRWMNHLKPRKHD